MNLGQNSDLFPKKFEEIKSAEIFEMICRLVFKKKTRGVQEGKAHPLLKIVNIIVILKFNILVDMQINKRADDIRPYELSGIYVPLHETNKILLNARNIIKNYAFRIPH